jgi:transposase
VARVAEGLEASWNTANEAVQAEGNRVLIDDVSRFDDVAVIGVDEHVWRHTRRGDRYVTVIILTGIRDGTSPPRLLDMVEGRYKAVFKTWLAERPEYWPAGVEIVAMDGFSGFKAATVEELPDAVTVMDPFHVLRLAGDALDRCRRRVQQDIHGHRGRTHDPLYAARRALHTGADLLTDSNTNG